MHFNRSGFGLLSGLLLLIGNSSTAQLPFTGMQVLDEYARSLQLNKRFDSCTSFCIRPGRAASFYTMESFDGVSDTLDGKRFWLQPVVLNQQFNSHHPYWWNDGSMIPAKGYQGQLSFGVSARKGILSIDVRPELVYAPNPQFETFGAQHSDTMWRTYYDQVLNMIDAPAYSRTGTFFKIFPGQSALRLNLRKLSLGLSTENLWWGPGARNSLLMSNNAPGFPHISFNTSQPVTSPVGSFEWQLISGKLKGSGLIPEDTSHRFGGQPLYVPKAEDQRYLNGVILTWQPKWTKGLFIGFSRVFYQYMSDVRPGLDGYLPVVGKFFKGRLTDEDEKKRDQMFSLFFRLLLQKEKAELYGEFGRNDHSQNLGDLLQEPEHSRAYVFGFSKIFDAPRKDFKLQFEMTNLQIPTTMLLRDEQSWYAHYQVRHGYTNLGQVIGAGIGPGSGSQTLGLQWGEDLENFGGSLERVVHNNDFYYKAFAPQRQWQHHWVDLALNLNKSWLRKNMLFQAQLSLVHSLNYQWNEKDVTQVCARVGVAYFLHP